MANLYLLLYNLVQTGGWGYCLYLAVQTIIARETLPHLWTMVELPLKIFQTSAVLEILHSALGLVRSPLVVTALQVFSRIWIVWGIINPVQEFTTTRSLELFRMGDIAFKLDLISLLIAWGSAEVIRYSFYALKELNIDSYVSKWLRYTGFIVLYPIGVSSELALVYLAYPTIKETGLWTLEMPNKINFSFYYHIACVLYSLSYIPFFPQLYLYMLSQRKKVLSPNPKSD